MGFIKRRWAGWNRAQRIGWSTIIIVVTLITIGALAGTSETPNTSADEISAADVEEIIEEAVEEAEASSGSYSSGLTSGQENALGQAESYLSHQSFSRKGLIEQLEYEGYSRAEATYAVDNVSVDWYDQAVLQAESYLSHQTFSRQGLLEQLLYEGFTRAQAEHGVSVAY